MAKFSKQHYEAIATAINKALDEAPIWTEETSSIRAAYVDGVLATAQNVSVVFADDNPRFNRATFVAAAMKRD